MISEFIIKLIMLFIMSLMCGMIAYIIFNKDNNYLMERLKRGHVITKRRSVFGDLMEIIKPFTKANIKGNKNLNSTKHMLIKLGLSANENDIIDFENKKTFLFIAGLFFSSIISLILIPSIKVPAYQIMVGGSIVVMMSYVGFKYPVWNLEKRIKKKEKAFDKFFPDAIDLLCVCVEAGLSIDSAIERVGREFSNFSYEVGYEFNRVAKDMLSGMSKQEALKGLAERVSNKDIQSFVAIINQADKMGASISHSLTISADSLRTKRKQRLEALVSAASVKMTIPLVACLLPATFTVILTPAIIQVMESLGNANMFR